MTALDELRQALAKWDRLTERATPRPWWGDKVGVWSGTGTTADRIVAETYSDPGDADAKLIEAAVGVADTVRAILADAISLVGEWEPQAAESYTPDALRLARKINENAA